jgi:hypothetical protein
MSALPDLREEARLAFNREIAAHASDLVANEMLFALAVQRLFKCSYEVAKTIPLGDVEARCIARVTTETRRRDHWSYDYPGHMAALQLKLAVEAKRDGVVALPDLANAGAQ